MATAYGNRPSDYFKFETEIGAWVFDEACLITGRQIENEVNEGKPPFSEKSSNSRSAYAPAAKANMKRVKINANGTW
jgi:hypothetical protein